MEDTKVLVQVNEVLNYLSDEDYEKIPKEIIDGIQENMDKEYKWEYDTSKELEEQDIDRQAIAYLSYLNMEYLLNEEEKKLMKDLHSLNQSKEDSNKEPIKLNELFENKEEKKVIENEVKETQISVSNKQENVFIKIINKIKSIFSK